MAKSTFSVYIFHQTQGFAAYLWNDIFRCKIWIGEWCCPLMTIVVVITILLVDNIIRIPLEKLWIQSKMFKFIEQKVMYIYREFG